MTLITKCQYCQYGHLLSCRLAPTAYSVNWLIDQKAFSTLSLQAFQFIAPAQLGSDGDAANGNDGDDNDDDQDGNDYYDGDDPDIYI